MTPLIGLRSSDRSTESQFLERQGDFVNTESDHDPVRLAADNAEDFLDTLIDNLRAKITNGTPLRPNSWAR